MTELCSLMQFAGKLRLGKKTELQVGAVREERLTAVQVTLRLQWFFKVAVSRDCLAIFFLARCGTLFDVREITQPSVKTRGPPSPRKPVRAKNAANAVHRYKNTRRGFTQRGASLGRHVEQEHSKKRKITHPPTQWVRVE